MKSQTHPSETERELHFWRCDIKLFLIGGREWMKQIVLMWAHLSSAVPLATEQNASNKSNEAMKLEKLKPFTRINVSLNFCKPHTDGCLICSWNVETCHKAHLEKSRCLFQRYPLLSLKKYSVVYWSLTGPLLAPTLLCRNHVLLFKWGTVDSSTTVAGHVSFAFFWLVSLTVAKNCETSFAFKESSDWFSLSLCFSPREPQPRTYASCRV